MPPPNLYAHVQYFVASIAHETAGAARTRSSLRPLISEGKDFFQNFGRTAPRECEVYSDLSHGVLPPDAEETLTPDDTPRNVRCCPASTRAQLRDSAARR